MILLLEAALCAALTGFPHCADIFFARMISDEGAAAAIVEKHCLDQVTDSGAIEKMVDEIIAANPEQVAKVKDKPQTLGWIVGPPNGRTEAPLPDAAPEYRSRLGPKPTLTIGAELARMLAGGARMFRVTLSCSCVPKSAGQEAASNIQREFADHRRHHKNVVCTFSNNKLVLTAENDFDPDGLALMDEFSDCITAYIEEPFDGEIRLVGAVHI